MERPDKNSPKANELGFDSLCPDWKADVQQDVRRAGIANFIVRKCLVEIQYGDNVKVLSEGSHPHLHDLQRVASKQVPVSPWAKAGS